MSHNIVFKERFTMKSFLVVSLFVCSSYASILVHNDDGNLMDHDDNDGAGIEGQALNLEERAAECNKGLKKQKWNRMPFEIKKGKMVCCHRNCPKCGGNNCAFAKKSNGKPMKDQDKKCCGKKIFKEGKYCQDQEDGRNEGPCIYSNQ